jgi:signal transduction histidine kinase
MSAPAGQQRTAGRPEPDVPPAGRAPYPPAFLIYLGLCVAGVLALLPSGFLQAAEVPLETLVWIAFLGASNLLTLQALPRVNLDVSVGAPVVIAVVVLLPPPLAALINFFGLTNEREFRGQAPLAMSLFNRCQVALAAGAAGWVVHTPQVGNTIVATVLAVIVYTVANTAFVGVMFWTRRKLTLVDAARQTAMPFPRFALDFGLVTMLALYIVLAYDSAGPFAAALLALPLWLGFSALQSSRKAEDRAVELADRVRELETLNTASAEFLTARRSDHATLVAIGALGNALGTDAVEIREDGRLGSAELRAIAVPGAEPAVVGVPPGLSDRQLAVAEAIAGLYGMTLVRQQLEQDLAEVQRARAALSGRILEEGTRERSRIALEIHDDVLPSLAAAQIQSDNVRSALAAGALDRADDIARAAHDAANGAIALLRGVLDDLHRQILVPGALRTRLADALDELRMHHGVEVALHAPEELGELPHAVEILLLETVRGCLANIAAHAGASRADIHLDVGPHAVELEVRDDGRGFDPGAVEEGHHGLVLMAQRIELARGRFTVRSSAGAGTSVQVHVPI